jgi:hypothetical protein
MTRIFRERRLVYHHRSKQCKQRNAPILGGPYYLWNPLSVAPNSAAMPYKNESWAWVCRVLRYHRQVFVASCVPDPFNVRGSFEILHAAVHVRAKANRRTNVDHGERCQSKNHSHHLDHASPPSMIS